MVITLYGYHNFCDILVPISLWGAWANLHPPSGTFQSAVICSNFPQSTYFTQRKAKLMAEMNTSLSLYLQPNISKIFGEYRSAAKQRWPNQKSQYNFYLQQTYQLTVIHLCTITGLYHSNFPIMYLFPPCRIYLSNCTMEAIVNKTKSWLLTTSVPTIYLNTLLCRTFIYSLIVNSPSTIVLHNLSWPNLKVNSDPTLWKHCTKQL